MKVNKPQTPFVGRTDAPTDKETVNSVKGKKFADALSALESAAMTDAAPNAMQAALTHIAAQYDLSDETARQSAVQKSAEFLVKSRLNGKYHESEKVVQDLSSYVADDPFLKTKLLSVLQRLSGTKI